MALVLARAVSELSDPALGRAVRAAGVHQPVDHQQGYDGVGVALHALSKKENYLPVQDETVSR